MNTVATTLSVEELEQVLIQTDPQVVLAPPRILRRIIRQHCKPTGPGVHLPHRQLYVLSSESLLQKASREELVLPPGRVLPDTVVLLERPDPLWLTRLPRDMALRYYWRRLFHARIHVELQQRSREGKPVPAAVRRQQIGMTEWGEIEAVLRQDQRLLPPGDVSGIYEELAALYLELRFFEPDACHDYFPSLENLSRIDELLAQDVDAARLLAATRPEGAAPAETIEPAPVLEEYLPEPVGPQDEAYEPLWKEAELAHTRGNVVRAAILRQRAVRVAPADQEATTRTAAEREIKQLVRRLREALGVSAGEAERWRQPLLALLPLAAQGSWSAETRLLYDLQKVCIDHEREVYAVDFIEWIASWGQKPIKRRLPHQPAVLMVKHLRKALYRLTAARLDEPTREQLEGLLREAVHDSEELLRVRLRPILGQALHAVGLVPRSVAEEVARDKLIEELLDGIAERYFLTMSDLRDALARNRLKLPDLGGFREAVAEQQPQPAQAGWMALAWLRSSARAAARFVLGDPLLQLNRRLATSLDGVYRRGEIYLRWLQRLSALAFGTGLGRLLTLYLVVPFGCSFMVLKMWDHIEELLGWGDQDDKAKSDLSDEDDWGVDDGGAAETSASGHRSSFLKAFEDIDPTTFAVLAGLVLLLLHARWFRRGLVQGLVLLWRGLRIVVHDWPVAVIAWPWVQRILRSRVYVLALQYLGKPLPPAVLAGFCAYLPRRNAETAVWVAAGTFSAVCLLVASRLGMYLEEVVLDFLERSWQLIRVDVIAGLGRLVIFLFKRLLEDVDRVLYMVDEWLRFRTGDSRLSLIVKPVLGLLWFVCTYLIRVVINLFVEPTFNPIKHFPVVTVTAKLIFPLIPSMMHEITEMLLPVTGKPVARMIAAVVIFLVPGLAGFIVWELKENWRLYRANQSPTLDPEIVGHHGETMLRLMRPGLHSGTLPKLFARLRQSEGKWARRQHEALHEVEAALQRFTQRSLLAVLQRSLSWGESMPLTLGHIHVGMKRLRLELCAAADCGRAWIDFDEQGGWLLAGLRQDSAGSWLDHLGPGQRATLRNALAGFYKLAGAQVICEQVEAALPPEALYALTSDGLVLWPHGPLGTEVVYPLRTEGELRPLASKEGADLAAPLRARDVLFQATPIFWKDWCQVWQEDQAGAIPSPLAPDVTMLPPVHTLGERGVSTP